MIPRFAKTLSLRCPDHGTTDLPGDFYTGLFAKKTPGAEVLFLGVSGLRKCQRVGSDHLQWDVASATGIGTVRTDAFGIYDIVEFP